MYWRIPASFFGVTLYFCDSKSLPCFLVAFSSLHSLQQLSGKNTWKMKGITLMWISVILKNTRCSPLVCRCHSKGNKNLLKKYLLIQSQFLCEPKLYILYHPLNYFPRAFSMSGGKSEWEEEAGGRENRVLHTSWISFFSAQFLKELNLRAGWGDDTVSSPVAEPWYP